MSRHEHNYSKYKKYLSMMMLICIKQHVSNFWGSIHKKLSNSEAKMKKTLLIKKCAFSETSFFIFVAVVFNWLCNEYDLRVLNFSFK